MKEKGATNENTNSTAISKVFPVSLVNETADVQTPAEESALQSPTSKTLILMPQSELATTAKTLSPDASAEPVNHAVIDDEIQTVSSSIGSGFAGFSSASNTPHDSTVNGAATELYGPECNKAIASCEHQNVPEDASGDGNGSKKAQNDVDMQKLQQRSSLNSVRGSAVNDVDLEIQQATPMKRRKQCLLENETTVTQSDELTNTPNLQTPPDQIVEINSNSTTMSQKHRRNKRNTKLQLKLHLHHQTSNHNCNRCSTESTSDLPVSSPSNPQGHGRSFPQRTALLKNTLPENSFEHNLALITAERPQMTLEEKIDSWRCDADTSDVEDVYNFDDLFKRHEELKKNTLITHKREFPKVNTESRLIEYDFTQFRSMMLREFCAVKHGKKDSNDVKSQTKVDKPTTSAEAAYLAAQRRLKAAIENENKKRLHKERQKGKNSTTPPATSSSENELACHITASKQKYQKHSAPQKIHPQKIVVYEKVLCPSSSEDASQDAGGTHNLRSSNAVAALKVDVKQLESTQSPPMRLQWTSTDEDSVFRLHRRHREIDKEDAKSQGLIKMRLDFANDKKDLHLQEKKNVLFKTPTVPQKYLASPLTILTNNNIKKELDDSAEKGRREWVPSNGIDELTLCNKTHHLAASTREECATVMSSNTAAAFHQQHEFCNYLGLTGMSTANAVANAVAELAKCNLTRRSLRVRRLQQKEKKDKEHVVHGIKDEKQLEALKLKQLRELSRREKGGRDISSQHTTFSTCSSLNHSPLLNSRRDNNDLIDKLALTKKEPEIKILCHISADTNRDEAEKVSKDCVKEITAPIRETLLRHLKQGVDSSYGTSTCPRSSLSENDDADEMSSNPTPKQPQSGKEQSSPLHIKQEQQSPRRCKREVSPKRLECTQLVQMLHEKFQRYLEASRKTKPSIFIVQSLHSMNGDNKNTELNKNKSVATKEINSHTPRQLNKLTAKRRHQKQEKNAIRSLQNKLQKRLLMRGRKPKDRLHKLLTRSAWNMSQQRQLRNRKIVLVKTIKRSRKTKTNNKSTQKNDKLDTVSEKSASSNASKKHKQKSDDKSYSSARSEAASSKSHMSVRLQRLRKRSSLQRRSHGSECDEQKHNQKRNTRGGSHCSTPEPPTSVDELKATPTEILSTTKSQPQPTTSGRISAGNDNDVVVVSSTTNNYEEPLGQDVNQIQVADKITKEISNNASFVITTKDNGTQSNVGSNGIHYLSRSSKALPNPIKNEHGLVNYIYYEMDVLIVVQERIISFWKYSKLINVLVAPKTAPHLQKQQSLGTEQHKHHQHYHALASTSESPTSTAGLITQETAPVSNGWTNLGECRRLITDIEIPTSYTNRICVHNSIPIYVEMRCREVPRERRDCNLLSMYINVYYYNDDEMIAKMHSIQLDAVQSVPSNVIYTTITESRYFVMAWPHENLLGKTRSGLCKYSLTPQLDTLASIREFKHMRHELRYLECTDDDKLLGFGDTQLTIWDHRSGDVLMNYDLDMPLGRNLGSIYYPSLEIGQDSIILLFQYIQKNSVDGLQPELQVIACCVSHVVPSHRILQCHQLPTIPFSTINSAISTGEHLIITAENDEEIWVSCADPHTITRVPAQKTRRFYARGHAHLIELTDKTLTVDSFANHVLKLAANTIINSNSKKTKRANQIMCA